MASALKKWVEFKESLLGRRRESMAANRHFIFVKHEIIYHKENCLASYSRSREIEIIIFGFELTIMIEIYQYGLRIAR